MGFQEDYLDKKLTLKHALINLKERKEINQHHTFHSM
jgi:hypothetical protein